MAASSWISHTKADQTVRTTAVWPVTWTYRLLHGSVFDALFPFFLAWNSGVFKLANYCDKLYNVLCMYTLLGPMGLHPENRDLWHSLWPWTGVSIGRSRYHCDYRLANSNCRMSVSACRQTVGSRYSTARCTVETMPTLPFIIILLNPPSMRYYSLTPLHPRNHHHYLLPLATVHSCLQLLKNDPVTQTPTLWGRWRRSPPPPKSCGGRRP